MSANDQSTSDRRPQPGTFRREFLRRALSAGAALPMLSGLLAACTSASPAAAPTATSAPAAGSASPAAGASPAARAASPVSSPAAAASPAVAAGGAAPPTAASTKDTLVVAQSQDIISLDPTQHTTYPTGNVLWHIYEPLVHRLPGGEYGPMLAASWQTLNDTTWQFKLRPNVKFSNGEAFDANAVKFSFDRALNPATNNRTASYLAAIDHVDVVDPLTVNFVTKQPYPVLLYDLSEDAFSAMILAPQYVQQQPDAAFKQPIGTGPYKLVSWQKDDRVTLIANADYWGGAPPIKNAIFRAIPEAAARVAELKSGGADLVDNVTPEQLDSIKSSGGQSAVVPSDFVMFVALDTLDPGPLQDVRVRQALNYAVDVDSIVQNVIGGLGKRVAVSLPLDAFGYPSGLQGYPYDPGKARQLLQEAGFSGSLTLPFISRNGRYLKDAEVVQAIGGFLADVGVTADIQLVTADVWSQVSDKHGRLGLSYPGWSGPDAELFWYPILHSGGIQSYVNSPQIDQLIEQGRATVNENQRKGIYAQLAQLLKDQAVHIPLFQSPLIYGQAANLNWTPHPDSIIDLRTAAFK